MQKKNADNDIGSEAHTFVNQIKRWNVRQSQGIRLSGMNDKDHNNKCRWRAR